MPNQPEISTNKSTEIIETDWTKNLKKDVTGNSLISTLDGACNDLKSECSNKTSNILTMRNNSKLDERLFAIENFSMFENKPYH
jgi:hypothetical protein